MSIKAMTDEQIQQELDRASRNLYNSTPETGSANYGIGGYERIIRSWARQLYEEQQRRLEKWKAQNASYEGSGL